MLAVYLAETGVSRHSSPFLILTDEFNPSLQPPRGREERRERKRKRKGKERRRGGLRERNRWIWKTEIGEKVSEKKETHIEMEKERKTDRKGRGLEEKREGA